MKRQQLILGLSLMGLLVSIGGLRLEAANVALKAGALDAALVYPNPWRSDRHSNQPIKFERLPNQAQIRLFTVSGHEVKTLLADSSGQATWDRTNASGRSVASGVYLYLVSDHSGGQTLGKIAIIR